MATIFKARYQEYHAEVTKEFMKWFQNGTYVDVTIHAGGQQLTAHKLVLAANSAFFNGVFTDTRTEHSHLYFTDVPFQSMKSLIEYMYSGDLVVEREFLPACLQLGDSLRVRGITDVNMSECITEPASVSQIMHNLINRIMQQQPLQQEQIPEEQPRKPSTRNQQKKHRRKSRKNSKSIEKKSEKGLQHVSSKLIFKRIRNTNGYKLQQFNSPKLDENINTAALDIPQTEVETVRDNSSPHVQQNNEVPAIAAESTKETNYSTSEVQEIDVYKEHEMPTDIPYDDLINIENAPIISNNTPQEVVVDGNRCNQNFSQPSNARFKSDVLEREVSNVGGDDAINMVQKICDDPQNNEPKLEITEDRKIVNSLDSAVNKDKCKPKRRKRSPRLPSRNLDQEFEKLFGDSYFGVDNKENNNNEKCPTNINERINELNKPEVLLAALAEVNNELAAYEDQQPRKKNGFRRRNPICPPPEDILRNGKPSFSCALCKRVYTHKSNYRRHYMVFHKRCAEAVFQCPMCKKKFTRSDNRTHHIRRIHGYTNTASLLSEEQALYYCPICEKAFTRSYNRTFHLAEDHGIRSPSILD